MGFLTLSEVSLASSLDRVLSLLPCCNFYCDLDEIVYLKKPQLYGVNFGKSLSGPSFSFLWSPTTLMSLLPACRPLLILLSQPPASALFYLNSLILPSTADGFLNAYCFIVTRFYLANNSLIFLISAFVSFIFGPSFAIGGIPGGPLLFLAVLWCTYSSSMLLLFSL